MFENAYHYKNTTSISIETSHLSVKTVEDYTMTSRKWGGTERNTVGLLTGSLLIWGGRGSETDLKVWQRIAPSTMKMWRRTTWGTIFTRITIKEEHVKIVEKKSQYTMRWRNTGLNTILSFARNVMNVVTIGQQGRTYKSILPHLMGLVLRRSCPYMRSTRFARD